MPRYSREEEKRRQRFSDAQATRATEEDAQVVEQGTPGDPSGYFQCIEVAVGDDRFLRRHSVMILARVSSYGQAKRGDLNDQVRNLKRAAKRFGLQVVGVFKYIGKADDPVWMHEAVKAAKRFGTIRMLAEDITRYIRHPQAHKNRSNYWWLPREVDFIKLVSITKGFQLLTLAPLDATHEEVRSLQTKRGQDAKDNKGGRPRNKQPGYKKKMREELIGCVHELRECGYSTRHIASHVSHVAGYSIHFTSVARWLKQPMAAAQA